MDCKTQKNISLNDLDFTTKETIEIEAPEKKQRIVITITKRHYYDQIKRKVITDQVVHKARYQSKKRKKDKGEDLI
ncbi:MAG: hypothetical protein ACMXYG_00155 [Candidatus Woesearchaeota archaeon]